MLYKLISKANVQNDPIKQENSNKTPYIIIIFGMLFLGLLLIRVIFFAKPSKLQEIENKMKKSIEEYKKEIDELDLEIKNAYNRKKTYESMIKKHQGQLKPINEQIAKLNIPLQQLCHKKPLSKTQLEDPVKQIENQINIQKTEKRELEQSVKSCHDLIELCDRHIRINPVKINYANKQILEMENQWKNLNLQIKQIEKQMRYATNKQPLKDKINQIIQQAERVI